MNLFELIDFVSELISKNLDKLERAGFYFDASTSNDEDDEESELFEVRFNPKCNTIVVVSLDEYGDVIECIAQTKASSDMSGISKSLKEQIKKRRGF